MNEIQGKIPRLLPDYYATLENVTGCKLIHKMRSDYSMSDSFRFWAHRDGECASEGKGDIEIRIYFSCRTSYFAIFTLDLKQRVVPYGHLLERKFLSKEVTHLIEKMCRSMESHHLTELHESQFNVLADGALTEMDGRPATLFEVYFAELI